MRKTEVNIADGYSYYKKRFGRRINKNTFKRIIQEYCKHMMYHVVRGDYVAFPSKFGGLSVRGYKRSLEEDGKINLFIDYKETKKLWEKHPEYKEQKKYIYHTNEHSDGYNYRFFWTKFNIMLENKFLYSLVLSRKNKRELAKHIKSGEIEYLRH